ncbi:hypothetical protein [Catenuloplanes atrovinosus]|uniref:YtkA-like domain-containing protein n=1 Tax=Catenuloplanes atrovinosus TaxID=137266 RepID=A0AAE4CCC8_9ACTN|nr:hypothetical protein [Catenuloplanes atrovinosus]MDR7276405.1 hypothetical protein [Catenuloplanes atrovinosus]
MSARTVTGLIALAVTAVLAVLGVVRAGRPDPAPLTGGGREFMVAARLDPAATGVIGVEIELSRRDGGPVAVRAVAVSAVMPAMGHVTAERAAEPLGPARFRVHGELFTMPGAWRMDVRVDTDTGSDVVGIAVTVDR